MTKKSKKAPTLQYGIEITKPFSKTMYEHNDLVAYEMKAILRSEITEAHMRAIGTLAATGGMDKGEKDLRKIGTTIEGSGYGDGYDLDEIRDNILNTLANIANWQLHEEYSYLCFEGMVPRTRFMMVGFEWQKHDYSYCQEQDLSPVSPEAGFNAEVEISCSLELDMQMANESENIQ